MLCVDEIRFENLLLSGSELPAKINQESDVCLVAWLPGCPVAWLPDCLVRCIDAWSPGCPVTCCLDSWSPGCLVVWLLCTMHEHVMCISFATIFEDQEPMHSCTHAEFQFQSSECSRSVQLCVNDALKVAHTVLINTHIFFERS